MMFNAEILLISPGAVRKTFKNAAIKQHVLSDLQKYAISIKLCKVVTECEDW